MYFDMIKEIILEGFLGVRQVLDLATQGPVQSPRCCTTSSILFWLDKYYTLKKSIGIFITSTAWYHGISKCIIRYLKIIVLSHRTASILSPSSEDVMVLLRIASHMPYIFADAKVVGKKGLTKIRRVDKQVGAVKPHVKPAAAYSFALLSLGNLFPFPRFNLSHSLFLRKWFSKRQKSREPQRRSDII